MAKEFEKLSKEFKPLKAEVQSLLDNYQSHCTNREHHKKLLIECAREIGRAVQGLKDNGVNGSTVDDFKDEKPVKDLFKSASDTTGALAKEEVRLKKIMDDSKATMSELEKLKAQVDSEVADRTKKSKRTILAVDSKSLPDLEALLESVNEAIQTLRDEVVNLERTQNWTAREIETGFEKWVKNEVALTKESRDLDEEESLADRLFDVRIVKRQMGKVKTLVQTCKEACVEAEKAKKNGQQEVVQQQVALALQQVEALKKIYAPYEKKIKDLSANEESGMRQTQDGKFILDNMTTLEQVIAGVSALVKKTARESA